MSKWSRRAVFALIILPLLVFVVGCPKKPPPESPTTTPPKTAEKPAPPPEEVKEEAKPFAQAQETPGTSLEDQLSDEIKKLNAQKPMGAVYFDFDKSDLRQDALEQLKKNAEWLKSNAAYRVRLEGNCDERGTTEYNLALGDRRAVTVRNYLTKAGIGAGRLETISYGEEHPANPGHDESAWAQNRRVDFTIIGKASR
jgi:peptidoglycan-associated lipoprotein